MAAGKRNIIVGNEADARPSPDSTAGKQANSFDVAVPSFLRHLPLVPGEAQAAIEVAKAHLGICACLLQLRRHDQAIAHASSAKRRMRRLIMGVFGPDSLPPPPILRPKKFSKKVHHEDGSRAGTINDTKDDRSDIENGDSDS